MSAGAVGAVVIFDYIQGKKWENDKAVQDGLAWMAAHYTVNENAGPPEVHRGDTKAYYLYYLYALDRVGMLYGTETVGSNLWYADGAKVLLDAQNADGSWSMSQGEKNTWDTCFAILFLKRATKPLDVATGGGR